MPNDPNITNIPSNRVEIIDPRTGMVSREWYRFFLNLFTLAGNGGNQTSLDDLQLGPPPQPDSGGGGGGSGTVTSVNMTVPTGLSVAGNPVTTAGTLAVTYSAGYALPTTAKQTEWDTAYADRLKWDGGATDLVAATGRTSLGATTVGSNFFTLADPTAITFVQINADNSITTMDAPTFRTAIGAGTGAGSVTSVDGTGGTGISVTGGPITTSGTLTITNTAPDQVVSLTAGTGISTTGTYPNFTITNTSPSLGGDVVGPASATDNAVARYDTTTGKLIQDSLVLIDDTGSVTGVNALTAESLTVNNNATLGFSNTDTLDVRSRIVSDLEPNTNNAKDIGSSGRNWRDGFFGRNLSTVNLEVTGTTSFDGQQGTSGQVLTSAGTGATPTWTTPTTGTVTSVGGTGTVSGLTLTGTVTTSGNLTLGGTLAVTPSDFASQTANTFLAAPNGSAGTPAFRTIVAADVPTLNQNTTGTAANVTGTVAIANGGTGQTSQTAAFDALAPTTTKGDLIVDNGTNNIRLPVGIDTYVLTADSAVAAGVKWAVAAGGGSNITAQGLWENNANITSNYSIASGNNGMSAGPISVASGVTVTVPTGSSWAIV